MLTRYIGRGKGSGVDVDTPGAHLWTVKDGRAVRMVVFSDRERALEAAGLQASDGAGGAQGPARAPRRTAPGLRAPPSRDRG